MSYVRQGIQLGAVQICSLGYIPPEDRQAKNIGLLYRYRSADSDVSFRQVLEMIKNRSLWFWHLTGQNDKNECRPIPFFGGDRKAIYRYFKDDFRSAYPTADIKLIKKQARTAARNPVVPDPRDVYRQWGVCCFSSNGSSTRMWSEYGANGNGVVICYKADETTSLGLAGKVEYTDEPIYLDLLKMNESLAYKIFTTKTTEWSHEAEYRIVERLPEPESGRSYIYTDTIIDSVTVGSQISQEKDHLIRELCLSLGVKVNTQQVSA
jgi:hypothetical protein